ncbi:MULTISPECIES: DUF2254 family protein [Gordonia]|uniref:DUF2254 domain-containing protein n=1 Tax=Gordonia jacobaea TaxID=122202 RepID=A0ABR5I7W7_9ACTN|nr:MULTISPECIES: DUF2254 family protein [Gordonia]KNA89744.1 hypothetical protein ABW18_18815 [Gordonia jacobaea]OBC03513.1 hypothetical protein A5785_01550 [Gordonia sp. 852002-50395_SCH5434458]OBC16531.1 hypothetical protein A5786_19715 [Gordonia sp. 852002-50816_SCH5313054-a]OBC20364.1 hypothetical protein A5788_06900 [Gordonia sp. 852002-50816_SCH5313054-c]
MTGLDTLGRRARAGLTQTIGVLFGAGAAIGLTHIGAAPQISTSSVATVLIGLGGAVFGTLAVIFSLLFLVVQWVATTFTPRLTLFRDAPIVWRTAAVAMSVIVFCITAILASGSRDTISASVPLVAVVGTLAVLVLLRVVLANALAATQISPVLTTICEHGQQSIVATYPTSDDLDPQQPVDSTAEPHSIPWSRNPLVLQRLHVERLVHLAESADAVIVMEQTVGSTLRAGATLAHVYGPAAQRNGNGDSDSDTGEIDTGAFFAALDTGPERTFDGDSLLAFRLIADIALRAMSPAINDPATAAQAVDQIEFLLVSATSIDESARRWRDAGGHLRLVVPRPSWTDMLVVGFDDVIAASLESPLMLARLDAALTRVSTVAATVEQRTQLARRRTWVAQARADRFPTLDQ